MSGRPDFKKKFSQFRYTEIQKNLFMLVEAFCYRCTLLSPSSPAKDVIATMDCRHVHFQYTEHFSESDLLQLRQLFRAAAFWAKDRSMDDMAVAIANSHPVVTVWDEDKLIGFSRATSDGVYRATIWDVVIDPSYQGSGLGRKLVQTVLGHPHVSRAERVYLMTTNQQGFYERIGFETNQTTTMVLYNEPVEITPALIMAEASQAE